MRNKLDLSIMRSTIEFKKAEAFKWRCTMIVYIGGTRYQVCGLGDSKLDAQLSAVVDATHKQFDLMHEAQREDIQNIVNTQ